MLRTPLVVALLLAPACGQDERETRRPNIVLLLADDAGYADFGFQRPAAPDLARRTPHIDSIARDGVRFTDAYMSGCVCSPARAGLLTGRYQSRFGHELNLPVGHPGGLPLTETTLADRMKALGYATGIAGKWHLGYPAAYHPNERGFDWFYGCLQGSRPYFAVQDVSALQVLQENGEPTPEGGHVTDRLGDAAVRFIDEHATAPFFLFVSFTAPHGPLQAKPGDLAQLRDIENQRRHRYAGLVKSLDDNVGKILAALRRHRLERDTLVVFTNDNGGQTRTGADNTPLRGAKGQLFEGGIRVPMCMRWPGTIEAGTTVSDPVIALDLAPTFAAAAGAPPPASGDGVDLLPRLRGEVRELRERALYWRWGGSEGSVAVRRGRFKLLYRGRRGDASPLLYDLADDVAESRDASSEHPDVVASLGRLLAEWEATLVDPLWRRN